MKKVIEWCEHHKNDPANTGDDDDNRRKTTDIDEWDQKFMQVDQEMLFEIILVSSPPVLPAHPAFCLLTDHPRLPTTSTSRLCWMSAARLSPT